MRANEKLKAPDEHEIALFPCEVMYLTPARDPAEHDVLSLDFLPRNIRGQVITAMPCYAPFSGKIVYTGNDHNCILESNDEVYFADGSLGIMRILVAHSFDAPTLGATYNQGDLFYRTGNYGQSFGEHLHIEIAKVNRGDPYWNSGGIGIRGAIHMWNGFYINDTLILRDGGFDWKTYGGPTPTFGRKKKKFPWVLYSNKLRNKLLTKL